MADISFTNTEVVPIISGTLESMLDSKYLTSVAVTAGQVVYLNGSSQWALAKRDSTALIAGSSQIAIAAVDAAAGQPLTVFNVAGNVVDFGASTTNAVQGDIALLSDTAGNMCPEADVTTTGHHITELGRWETSRRLLLTLKATGILVP